jgi:hypothetical protein
LAKLYQPSPEDIKGLSGLRFEDQKVIKDAVGEANAGTLWSKFSIK